MKRIVIHSDGACQGNPGPGGWAAVLTYGERRREISGGIAATTNNRMEIQGAAEALRCLKEPCEVEFYTDSKYLRSGITEWVPLWKKNGWATRSRKPVKNADLWRALDAAAAPHRIAWKWVKGHSGDSGNERCDTLATGEIEKIRRSHSQEQLSAALKNFTQPNDLLFPDSIGV